MRRMARPGEYDGEMELLDRHPSPLPRPSSPLEDGPNLEEPDIPIPDAPVVLDATHEAREQPAAQMGLLGRERVQDRHGVRSVGGTQGQRSGFEEAAPAGDELLPDRK